MLMVLTESDGLARKKSDRGIDSPAVGPVSHVVPDVSVRAPGTNTLYVPSASTYRYGFSRRPGVVARVVYGGLGKVCAGAPWTPANPWFHTALDHPPMLLFR